MSSQPRPGAAERLRARLRVAVQHPERVDAGDPERDEPRPRRQPETAGGGLADDEHRRGAVDDLARVAGGHDAVLDEGGLERGELLGGGVAARRLVDEERRRRPASATGTISRSNSPPSIAAIARRFDSSANASSCSREICHSFAISSAEMPCGTIGQRSAIFGLRPAQPSAPRFEPIGTRDIDSTPAATTTSRWPAWIAAAALNAACIDEPHWRSTVVAATVSGQPATSAAIATDVERLLADLRHAPHLHVLDLGGIEPDPADEAVEHVRGEIVGAHGGEGAVAAADRGANGVDDECVGHRRSVSAASRRRRCAVAVTAIV